MKMLMTQRKKLEVYQLVQDAVNPKRNLKKTVSSRGSTNAWIT